MHFFRTSKFIFAKTKSFSSNFWAPYDHEHWHRSGCRWWYCHRCIVVLVVHCVHVFSLFLFNDLTPSFCCIQTWYQQNWLQLQTQDSFPLLLLATANQYQCANERRDKNFTRSSALCIGGIYRLLFCFVSWYTSSRFFNAFCKSIAGVALRHQWTYIGRIGKLFPRVGFVSFS